MLQAAELLSSSPALRAELAGALIWVSEIRGEAQVVIRDVPNSHWLMNRGAWNLPEKATGFMMIDDIPVTQTYFYQKDIVGHHGFQY